MRTKLASVLAVLASCGAQARTLWECTFDGGNDGWMTAANQAPAETQGAVAKEGGALALSYTAGTEMTGLAAPLPVVINGARSVKFWLRTSHDGLYALVLGEEGEFTWLSLVPCTAGAWREFEVSLDRFRPDDQKPDPNGQLDPGLVRFVAIFDASAFLGQAAAGQRQIWLDSFQIADDEAANAYSFDQALPYLLDDFQATYHSWLALCGKLEHDPDEGLLTWRYDATLPQGAMPGIATALGQLPKSATHLYLTLRSERAMNLAIVLQEGKRGGLDESNYVALKQLRAGQFETLEIELSALQLDADNSSDENGRFDLDQIGMLLLMDVDLIAGQAAQANVLTIDELELVDEG